MKSLCIVVVLAGCNLYFEKQQGSPPPGTDVPDAAPSLNKRVFVTSATYQGGKLGGHGGADAICQRHANAAHLGGAYKAWLSSTAKTPASWMTHVDLNYVLVDGTVVAHGWDDLTDGAILHAIDTDETGAYHEAAPSCMLAVAVWSDTEVDATRVPTPPSGTEYSCNGWTNVGGTGLLGNVRQTDLQWTHYGCAVPCSHQAALYCVEQ